MTTPSHIQSACDDLKRLVSKCKTEDERLMVAKFGLYVLMKSQRDLLSLLAERPQWLEALGVRLVPEKTADLTIDELLELRWSQS